MLDSTPPPLVLTRATAVADELRRLIRSGELPAGTRLRQVDFARRFGVSTTPVREAFTSLAREGLVRQDAHRGVIVFVPSRDDLIQNYEIRLVLEPLATRHAALNATPDDLEKLADIMKDMRAAIHSDIPRYAADLNPRFHAAIYDAACRPRLAELIHQLRDASAAYTQLLALKPQSPRYHEGAHAQHEQILEALRTRSAKKAADMMRKHLEINRDQILASLNEEAT